MAVIVDKFCLTNSILNRVNHYQWEILDVLDPSLGTPLLSIYCRHQGETTLLKTEKKKKSKVKERCI